MRRWLTKRPEAALILLLTIPFITSCDDQRASKRAKVPPTAQDLAQQACLKQVVKVYADANVKLLEQEMALLSKGQPTAGLTLLRRRLQEQYCTAEAKCLSSDQTTRSLLFENCLTSEAKEE